MAKLHQDHSSGIKTLRRDHFDILYLGYFPVSGIKRYPALLYYNSILFTFVRS